MQKIKLMESHAEFYRWFYSDTVISIGLLKFIAAYENNII